MFDEEYDLSAKQRELAFVYMNNGFCQWKAYRDVYKCDDKTAQSKAYSVFKNLELKRFIEDMLQEKLNVNLLNSNTVLNEIMSIAFDVEQKTSDRLKALELLGKNLQLFTDKLDVSGNGINISIVDDL